MTFDTARLLNQHVVVRDRSGKEYTGFMREVHSDVYVLRNGDGTVTIINRSDANVSSVRVLADRGGEPDDSGRMG